MTATFPPLLLLCLECLEPGYLGQVVFWCSLYSMETSGLHCFGNIQGGSGNIWSYFYFCRSSGCTGWIKYCLEPCRTFFFLHGLISVFLLLGKGAKHEKLVFTILAHPVQNKALFKRVPFSSLTVLWMPPALLDQITLPRIFPNWVFTRLGHKNTPLI